MLLHFIFDGINFELKDDLSKSYSNYEKWALKQQFDAEFYGMLSFFLYNNENREIIYMNEVLGDCSNFSGVVELYEENNIIGNYDVPEFNLNQVSYVDVLKKISSIIRDKTIYKYINK